MTDFLISNHGSVFILAPQTDAATDWTSAHLPDDAPQWCGDFVIEAAYINDILQGIVESGLTWNVPSWMAA